ncbi:MAG: methylenetetrahydrofolate--tRNA-(uracil(54)-C(5))-methyltransferase (FADH(2)-oxidizing) TrmFO [Firmicutes bacterium]|nr:methylenetetrahydrofolate--tRNA-(uracil(54)-C(5))-methyltransferase (FADH(2)-oxidizing) TrmFO [Bacillota bacterium]
MGEITVVGGGLAGAEAAWQLAERGHRVNLIEMRPAVMTPAHRTGLLAELVCSNSFRGASLENAGGLLKEEMRRLGSLIMAAADATRIPAGGALAVDRTRFAEFVTERLHHHPLVRVRTEEATELPVPPALIATGPLTAGRLAASLRAFFGHDHLHFYDAIAPVVYAETLDMDLLFRASRYGKGDDAAYLNSPLTEEEYDVFWRELLAAEVRSGHLPEDAVFFEGCLPIEEMARRGKDTLRFGPMKPVGLVDPRTGRRPYAVVQLRQDDAAGALYNLVGFQTRLAHGEQERVFRLLPGLARAEFARFGGMHRNSYLCSPVLLRPTGEARKAAGLFFAGQLIGVEGYVESAASGLVAGINLARRLDGEEPFVFPRETALGALMHYVTSAAPDRFQPMNVNFGLFPPLDFPARGRREKARLLAERALTVLEKVRQTIFRK